jgi:hypothetical protein
MDADKQCRIDTAQALKGVRLQRRKWKATPDGSDHDHCAVCWAKLAEWDSPGILHEGYTTCDDFVHGAGYEWVCEMCFTDLKDDMEWRLVPPGETGR